MIINSLISGGGGQETTGDYTVTVIDYDGTILLETKGNTGDVIDLPTAPTHDKLIFEEWSASVEVVNNQVTIADNNIMVGAIYKTASGQSEFDITLTKVTGLSVRLNMDGTKDWGDGTSDTETTHTYTAYGDYTIKCDGTTVPIFLFGQGNGASYHCVRVRLGNVTEIIGNAFIDCRSLTNIVIPSSVTSFGGAVFQGCNSLKCIIIPSSVTSIGNNTFQNCRSLTNIVIPSGVTRISSAVLSYCVSLTSITIPNNATSIVADAFQSCNSLKGIIIPSGVTSIGNNAFQNCYSLIKIDIPSGVTSIGNNVFYDCYPLTDIMIPSNVTSIGSKAFGYCYSITKYDFSQCTSVPTLSNTNAFTGINAICKIIVPDNLAGEWAAATNWSTYADYIYKVSEV